MCEGTDWDGFGGPVSENQLIRGEQLRAEPTGPAEHHLVWEWMGEDGTQTILESAFISDVFDALLVIPGFGNLDSSQGG